MASRHVTITPDVLDVGFHTITLPQPASGYRNVSSNAEALVVMVSRKELQELKALLVAMDLE